MNWPESLPNFLIRSFQEGIADTTIRTPFDTGEDQVRRRFTAGVDSIAGNMTMDKTQKETLDTFYKETTRSGALRFNFYHPTREEMVEVRFMGSPSISARANDIFTIQIEFEVLP